jgi:hypothetical protein
MAFWIALGITALLAVGIPFCVAVSRGTWKAQHFMYHDNSSAWASAWWALVFFAFFMFVGGLTATQGRTDPRDYNATAQVNLQALKSPTSYEGHFFLASGTVDEELVYRYLTKSDDGLIERDEIRAHRAWIIEEGEDAYLEYRWQCNTWTFPWGACLQPAYVFYVPTGSVLNEYEVTP